MSFIGEAIGWLGTQIASGAAAGSTAASLGSALQGVGSFFSGIGSGFWTALGAGATVLGTMHTISMNNAMARQQIFNSQMTAEASALDTQRRRADTQRETEAATARRSMLLAAQGGLYDGADLVLDALLEGARADQRLAVDMGFEQGAIARRISNIQVGRRMQNTGALIQGGARIADLLARA